MLKYKDINGKEYYPTIMLMTLLSGGFISVLTETFLNNALLSIMNDFHVTQNTVQWLSTGYLLVVGVMIPLSTYLFKKFEAKKLFISMLVIFLIGSTISFISHSFIILFMGRMLQAVAAGGMMPLVSNIILLMYPKEKRSIMMGMTSLVIAFAPAIGPTLSGIIVDYLSWRYLFGLLIPLTILFIVLSCYFVHSVNQPESIQTDILSIIYSSIGFGILLYVFSEENISFNRLILLVLSIIILILFCKRQLTISSPLIDLSVFKNKRFNIMAVTSSIISIALLGIELVLPLFLQSQLHISALTVGLIMLPGAILNGIVGSIAGMIHNKIGIKKLMSIGYTLIILGTIPMIFYSTTTSILFISLDYTVRILGISLLFMTSFTEGINSLDDEQSYYGNTAMSTMRQIASSFGTALLVSVIPIGNHLHQIVSFVTGYRFSFFILLLITVIGLFLTLFVKKDEKI